ncbi:MAG: STT3 domain-containing protein [Candidatus Woesearchaeota archaeon]|nr:STT3 domain-containing protein [Candidatus Woesearchaeota archaeon]
MTTMKTDEGKNEKKEEATISPQSSSPNDSNDITVDFSKIWHSAKQFRKSSFLKTALAVLLLIIPLILSIYIRAQPIGLTVTKDWAHNAVDNALRNQLSAKIDEQYGNVPVESKQRILDKEFSNFVDRNPNQYQSQLNYFADQYKSQFSAPDGTAYLGDIDSYLWLRKAQNILDHGNAGTEIRDGRTFDGFLVAPNGDFTADNWHPRFIVMVYKFISLFKSVSLAYAQFYVPVIVGALATLFAFLIGKKLTNSFGGFFAGMIAAANPVIVSRTVTTDSDSYTVLFHFLVIWLFLQALTAGSLKKKAMYAGLLGLSLSVFSMIWEGWWYSFDLMLFVLVALAVYYIVMEWRKKSLATIRSHAHLKTIGIVLLGLVLSSFLFVSLFRSPSYYIHIQSSIFTVPFTLQDATKVSLWPNVYTTVAELNQIDVSNIMPQLGSGLLVVLGFFSIALLALYKRSYFFALGGLAWYAAVYVLFTRGVATNTVLLAVLLGLPVLGFVILSLARKKEIPLIRLASALLFVLWVGSMFYASTNGIRFVVQIVVGLALLMGVGVGTLVTALPQAAEQLMQTETFKIKSAQKYVTRMVMLITVIFFCFILIAPAKAGISMGRDQAPIFDDGWYNTMMKIKSDTAPDAIITSWWDFGHYFKAIGNRRVTFDGGTQNRPQAHWVGKILLTSDEDEALHILRMLNCGGNNAFDSINKIFTDPLKSIKLTYGLLRLDKQKGTAALEKITNKEDAQRIAGYLYCTPPESIFITSEDMRGKGGVWSHFGSWDFERAKIWLEIKNKNRDDAIEYLQKEFNYPPDQGEKIYNDIQQIPNQREANTWITGWPNYMNIGTCEDDEKDTTSMRCTASVNSNRVVLRINKDTKDVFAENSATKQHPNVIVWQDATGFHERRYDKNTLEIGVALIGNNILIMDKDLAASMFTRLFFFQGGGLKHFTLLADEQSTTTGKIFAWKVAWPKEWLN